ncbi:MAG: hypothetical protein QNJ85_16380 [Gammaproteobacteria bacterium]|nr:hypothetical protein [Gammaproteobacteria bacterium]
MTSTAPAAQDSAIPAFLLRVAAGKTRARFDLPGFRPDAAVDPPEIAGDTHLLQPVV